MKQLVSVILQFGLFLLIFAAGSFLPPFHLRHVLSLTAQATRVFFWDGVVLMVGVLVVIWLIEAVRRQWVSAAWTLFAFLMATAVGLAAKLGFMTVPR